VRGPYKVFIDGKKLPDVGGGVDVEVDTDEVVLDALHRKEVTN
jgi:hypothetical protein